MPGVNVASEAHAPAGVPIQCLSIAIELHKEPVMGANGQTTLKCGLRVGGGIDQDPAKSPHKYPDSGIYVTHIEAGGPADRAGLRLHDKILQVNGYDFTMVTHEKAVHYINKYEVLKMLVARQDMPSLNV